MKKRKYGIELLQLLPEPFRSSHQNSLNSYKRELGDSCTNLDQIP